MPIRTLMSGSMAVIGVATVMDITLTIADIIPTIAVTRTDTAIVADTVTTDTVTTVGMVIVAAVTEREAGSDTGRDM
jgi:hypothetical protein